MTPIAASGKSPKLYRIVALISSLPAQSRMPKRSSARPFAILLFITSTPPEISICRLIYPDYTTKEAAAQGQTPCCSLSLEPVSGKNIESSFAYFSFKKSKTYFSMTSFVSRAIISSSLVSMISVRTRAPQAVTSTTSFFCLWASRFLSVSMRMPSQSM